MILKNLKKKFEKIREERDALLQVTEQQKQKIDFLEAKVKVDEDEKEQLTRKLAQVERENAKLSKEIEESRMDREHLAKEVEEMSRKVTQAEQKEKLERDAKTHEIDIQVLKEIIEETLNERENSDFLDTFKESRDFSNKQF